MEHTEEKELHACCKSNATDTEACTDCTEEKTRYKIPAGNGLTWEIDEFHGVNEGLIVAEIEVPSEDTSFEKPDWLGEEVSSDPRYFNSNLVSHPYTTWNK